MYYIFIYKVTDVTISAYKPITGETICPWDPNISDKENMCKIDNGQVQ